MYSSEIVEKRLFALRKQGVEVERRSVDECVTVADRLNRLYDPESGKTKRSLTPKEQAFIRSEVVLCKYDFRYFATRYGFAEKDASEGGGVGPTTFWPSQERALELIARREEENYRNLERHGFAEGIKIVWHKTRQQGATAIARLISGHRMCLWKNTRCLASSLDDTKCHELYVRDKVILDNLPFFLKPKVEFDVKDSHIAFEKVKSRLTYQQANQEAGVGTGQQFDVSHITEVALWGGNDTGGYRLIFDFFPAIPQSVNVFVGMESTANGRGGFWHEFTEDVRHKRNGYETWIYSFTPWYINHNKNRRVAPDGWEPEPHVKEMVEVVEKTSAEFAGKKINLTKDQLYWWATEHSLNKRQGTLHVFFSNYPTTPEESFQHSERSALPIETIQWMRSTSVNGMPYYVEAA